MFSNQVTLYRDLDPSTTAAINSSANILSSDASMLAQSNLNKKTQQWNEKMYNLEHSNAIADWNMQNQYNSPQAQMARDKAAGLNPNLIYGSGTDAGGVASPVSEKSHNSWNPTAPTGAIMGVGNALSDYTDQAIKLQQLDNLKAANAQTIQDTALKAAETLSTNATAGKTGVDTASDQFDLQLKSDLRDISLQTQQSLLKKIQAETTFTIDQNDRDWIMNKLHNQEGQLSMKETLVDIMNKKLESGNIVARTSLLGAETANTNVDTQLKGAQANTQTAEYSEIEQKINNLKTSNYIDKLDAALKANNIQPGDSAWMRWIEILGGQFMKTVMGKKGTDVPLRPATPPGMFQP